MDLREVDGAITRLLSEVGVKVANKHAFELFKAKGIETDEEKKLVYISRGLLEDCIASTPSELILYGRGNPGHILPA